MARLKIKDAPLLPSIQGDEKIPTGMRGDYTVTPDMLSNYIQLKLPFATKAELSQVKYELEQQIETVQTTLSSSISTLSGRVTTVESSMVGFTQDLNLHKADTSNPHNVTKQQVGLGSVDNTSDVNKPVSNATAQQLSLKADIASVYNKETLDKTVFGNTYYVEKEGFVIGGYDNSDKWDALLSKIKDGDTIQFGFGYYHFSRPINVTKALYIRGRSKIYTTIRFPNSTHGIIRHVRDGELRDLGIHGTTTSVTLNPKNKILGNIGLYDKYGEGSSSGYFNTIDVRINYFDTGRANINDVVVPNPNPTGIVGWAGAYRETYNIFIQRCRIGCVFLNGATDDKYYGGIISANSEIGIWAYDDGKMYNNIKFFGVTIEGNGDYDPSVGYLNAVPTQCNIYSAGASSIYLIGSYNEKSYNIAEDGGQIYKIGCHQHGNAVDVTKNGFVMYSGCNWGELNYVPYYNRLSSFIFGFSGATVTPSGITKAVNITSNLDQSSIGYSIRSRNIELPSGISTNKIKGLRFRIKFKVTSGYTQNAGLRLNPIVTVYAKDGSYAGLRTNVFSKYQLEGGNGQEVDISVVVPLNTVTTPTTWNFNPNQELSHVVLNLGLLKGDGTNPNFSVDNLNMVISDFDIGLFSMEELNLTEYRNKRGLTTERPTLTTIDAGYTYFDTTLNYEIRWDGSAWQKLVNQTDLPVVITNATTNALSQKIAGINTTGKTQGKMVFNVTDTKIYYATGIAVDAVWKSTDGLSTITPV